MKEITLSNGLVVLVDAEDYPTLIKHKWQYAHYAVRNVYCPIRRRGVLKGMHRLLMGDPAGMDVDHKNGNRLDNRKANLRICTRQENIRNSRKHHGDTSKFKGICFDRSRNMWKATIKYGPKQTILGWFNNEVDAARAYDEAAKLHFGEFARTNETA